MKCWGRLVPGRWVHDVGTGVCVSARGEVAQISMSAKRPGSASGLYRRIAFCRRLEMFRRRGSVGRLQIENLRNSRVQLCATNSATLNSYRGIPTG